MAWLEKGVKGEDDGVACRPVSCVGPLSLSKIPVSKG
jgi:hypothetical protein